MCRFISITILILLTLLSSACYFPRFKVTQDSESLISVHINNRTDMQFRKIPNRDFWMGTTEVTLAQIESWNSRPDPDAYYKREPGYQATWPAMNIRVTQASSFCTWLSRHLEHGLIPKGYSVRLPTAEEWEYAARCGTERLYPWGNEWPPVRFFDGQYPNAMGEDRFPHPLDDLGGYYYGEPPYEKAQIRGYEDGFPGPCPVELAGKNEWGIVGLAGNVAEWCWDEKNQDVLKGGDWMSYHPHDFNICEFLKIDDTPWPFCSIFLDRKSYHGSGFRVVIAPK